MFQSAFRAVEKACREQSDFHLRSYFSLFVYVIVYMCVFLYVTVCMFLYVIVLCMCFCVIVCMCVSVGFMLYVFCMLLCVFMCVIVCVLYISSAFGPRADTYRKASIHSFPSNTQGAEAPSLLASLVR